MNIWEILDIDKTDDKSSIKKAYRAKLKITHPEEEPEAFMKLREAYEKALEYADNAFEYEEEDIDYTSEYEDEAWDEESDYEETYQEKKEYSIQREVAAWWHRVNILWKDYGRRCDIEEWKKLLYDDIPYKLVYFDKCRQKFDEFFFSDYAGPRYIPNDIWKLLDNFFSFSPKIHMIYGLGLRYKNKRIKLCEMIDFKKAIVEDVTYADDFFMAFERMAELMTHQEREENKENWDEINNIRMPQLDKYNITYLPYECIRLALQFDSLTEKEINQKIEQLTSLFGSENEIKLLKAQYMLYLGRNAQAERILKKLYKSVPAKNFPYIFQLAVCCEHAAMYFETYMLIKQLMWLNPNEYIEKRANVIYELMEKAYINKLEEGCEITDLEKIQMCRMYLRSNREKDAKKLLDEVNQQGADKWHYHVVRCLVYFNEDDISPMASSWKILEKFNKEKLNAIERLEWEELKARYLFEQKEYEQCMDKCNELLDEYPVSAVILLLREYADCSYDDGDKKKYFCLEYLLTIMPQRLELYHILIRHIRKSKSKESKICKLLKNVKEKCFEEYEFARIRSQYDEKYSDEAKKQWIKLFKRIKNREINMPAVSKYECTDLRLLYANAAATLYKKYDKKIYEELKNLLISLAESKYNEPEKYADLLEVYFNTENNQMLVKEGLKRLKTEKDSFRKYLLYYKLIAAYGNLGEPEQIDSLWAQLEEMGMPDKKYDIYVDLYNIRFKAYTDAISHYDENLYKRAEKYCDDYLSMIRDISDYYNVYILYERWGRASGDKNIYLKGISIFLEALERCGKVGDMHGLEQSIYLLIARLYGLCGMKKEAMAAIEDMKKYSKDEEVRRESYLYIADVYDELGMLDLAKEYYLKAEENGSWVLVKQLRCYLKNGDYKEARNIFLADPDPDDYVYAVHTKYMETGLYDLDEIREIKDRLESSIEKMLQEDEGNRHIGTYYARLTEMCNILGEKENEEYYRQAAADFKWDDARDRLSDLINPELWILWYQKEYRKAWELLQANKICLSVGDIEVTMFEYLLGKMFK